MNKLISGICVILLIWTPALQAAQVAGIGFKKAHMKQLRVLKTSHDLANQALKLYPEKSHMAKVAHSYLKKPAQPLPTMSVHKGTLILKEGKETYRVKSVGNGRYDINGKVFDLRDPSFIESAWYPSPLVTPFVPKADAAHMLLYFAIVLIVTTVAGGCVVEALSTSAPGLKWIKAPSNQFVRRLNNNLNAAFDEYLNVCGAANASTGTSNYDFASAITSYCDKEAASIVSKAKRANKRVYDDQGNVSESFIQNLGKTKRGIRMGQVNQSTIDSLDIRSCLDRSCGGLGASNKLSEPEQSLQRDFIAGILDQSDIRRACLQNSLSNMNNHPGQPKRRKTERSNSVI